MRRSKQTPARWMEHLLERLLGDVDSPTITGDLREEYTRAILPAARRVGADCWYARQVVSLLPLAISRQSHFRKALLIFSLLTLAANSWLAIMECLLHRSGYVLRAFTDLSIAIVPLITIVFLVLHIGRYAGLWLGPGAITLIAIGVPAFLRNERSPHFEGFVFVISMALTVQGILIILFLAISFACLPRNGTLR